MESLFTTVSFSRKSPGAVLDGFHIINGDATPEGNETALIKSGGGIVMGGSIRRRVQVAGGTMTATSYATASSRTVSATKGAALYAAPHEGGRLLLDDEQLCHQQQHIFLQRYGPGAAVYFDIPDAAGSVSVKMDHQTIVKNVGYGVYATLPGKVSLIRFVGMEQCRFAITDCTQLKEADALTLKNVSATYCAFDNGANIPRPRQFLDPDLQ